MKSERARQWTSALKMLVDAALIALSFVIAYWVRYQLQLFISVEPWFQVPLRVYVPSLLLLTAAVVLALWIDGAYRPARGRLWLDEMYIVLRAALLGVALTIVIVFLATPGYYSRLIFGYTGLILLLVLGIARGVEALIRERLRKRGVGVQHVLVVGAGEMARAFMRTVVACPELGYVIVGVVDDNPAAAKDIGRFAPLGGTADVPRLLSGRRVDEVVIALPWTAYAQIQRIAEQCQRSRVRVRIVPDLFQMALTRVVVENVNGIPLLAWQEPAIHPWQTLLKRGSDVVVAVLALVLLSPLFAIVAVAIRLDTPGPVIFRQRRVGRAGKEFTIWKFRSMVVDAEAKVDALRSRNEATGPLFKIRKDPRLTRVGRILRRTSIDELPQLWNVLRGEMSLVGPRPSQPQEVEHYDPDHFTRLLVKPGVTGMWQVSGRSDLGFEDAAKLDADYVRHWSLLRDLRILARTVVVVLQCRGAC
ncbi:MAG: sugar transferase [Chloroflexi bacterium]|nr:sugar transferase [Chloroflexota bacterium]